MADRMTSEEVAQRLGVTRATVSRLVKGGKLAAAGEFAGNRIFDRSYIELFAATYERSPRGRKPRRQAQEVAA